VRLHQRRLAAFAAARGPTLRRRARAAGGHAFERASGHFKRRPTLDAGAKAGAIDPKPWLPDTSAIEPKVRTLAENAAVHAGLRLPGHIMEELVAVAPWALAMARRLKRDHPREAETASIFDPGRDID
jgi:hypothetical protein